MDLRFDYQFWVQSFLSLAGVFFAGYWIIKGKKTKSADVSVDNLQKREELVVTNAFKMAAYFEDKFKESEKKNAELQILIRKLITNQHLLEDLLRVNGVKLPDGYESI